MRAGSLSPIGLMSQGLRSKALKCKEKETFIGFYFMGQRQGDKRQGGQNVTQPRKMSLILLCTVY